MTRGRRAVGLLLFLFIGSLTFAGVWDDCICQLNGGPCTNGGGSNDNPVLAPCDGTWPGCISDPVGRSPGAPPPSGGFSAGGWDGTGTIAPGYSFGVIDSTRWHMSELCPWNYPPPLSVVANEENPYEVPAIRALWNSSKTASAFFFLTSLYHVTSDQCATPAPPGLTATQWGIIQADLFVQMVHDACQQNPCQPIDYYFGDLERVFDEGEDQAGWVQGTDNAMVVSAFEMTLYNYCGMNQLYGSDCPYPGGIFTTKTGLYTSETEITSIPYMATGYPDPAIPDLSTDVVWVPGYVYPDTPQSVVNANENFFTNQGWRVYSWQYATDACTVTYASARAMAQGAAPRIPRFDL